MTNTNLQQMPFKSNLQKDAFYHAALRREDDLLFRVCELEAKLDLALDAFNDLTERQPEIKAQAVEEAVSACPISVNADTLKTVLLHFKDYANKLRQGEA